MRLSVWVVKFRFAWWKGFGSRVFLAANLAAMRRQAADQQSLVSVHDIQHNLQVFRSSLRVSSFSRYKSCMSWPPSSSVYKTLNYKKYNILSPSLYSFLSSTRFTYNSASTFDPLQSNDWIIGCREAASKGLVEIITLFAEEQYEALHLTWQCSTNILFRFFKGLSSKLRLPKSFASGHSSALDHVTNVDDWTPPREAVKNEWC